MPSHEEIIKQLQDELAKKNELIGRLEDKQRRHKEEIVELHGLRRRLQAQIEGLERTENDAFTQEQREFLWLAEEAAEVVMAVLKGLRFGMNNNHPMRVTTNRSDIAKELGHVHAAVTRLMGRPSLDPIIISNACIDKRDATIPGVDIPARP